MSSVIVKEVLTKRQRLEFIKMPWKLYRSDPHWVPPIIADQKVFLDPRRGVFFDHGEASLYLAYRDGKSVGRITAHVNHLHENRFKGDTGFFGFFECEDNQETADALLSRAVQYCKERGKTFCEGPMNFGLYDELGILVQGFDSDPYLLSLHNPPYYQKLLEAGGFGKAIDWYAFRGLLKDYPTLPDRLIRIRDRAIQRAGLTIRAADINHMEKDTKTIRHIFEVAWEKNWGHVPLSDREFERSSEEIIRVLVPGLTLLAEKNGKPAGFILTTYDANVAVKKINGRLFPFGFIRLLRNLKKTDKVRLIFLGVLEEFRGRGIEMAMMMLVAQKAYEMGFREMEMSLIVENNKPMIGSLKYFPAEIEKVWRIFHKKLK